VIVYRVKLTSTANMGLLFLHILQISLLVGVRSLPEPKAQVWDVDRLIRARNPGAAFTTTLRPSTTWQTLRSITYNPLLEAGAVGSASVEEASLVRRVKPSKSTESSSSNQRLSLFLFLLPFTFLVWIHMR